MSRPSELFRRPEGPRNPWTWPLVALIGLVGVVLVGTVLALMFAGCGQVRDAPATRERDDSGAVQQQSSTMGMEERKVTLSDGRVITCITWVDSGYQYENTAAGLSCDWWAAAK